MKRPARRRRAFTLIEVITALTLTAMVLGVAGAALGAAGTTRRTIVSHQRSLEAEARLRSVITDMLRHVPSPASVSEPLLRVERTPRGDTQLIFLSVGVREPFGTGHTWRVTLSTDADGLSMDAVAIGRRADDAHLHTTVAGIDTLTVDVLEPARPGEAARWRNDWPLARALPTLVRMRFGSSAFASPPMIVALAPLETR